MADKQTCNSCGFERRLISGRCGDCEARETGHAAGYAAALADVAGWLDERVEHCNKFAPDSSTHRELDYIVRIIRAGRARPSKKD